MIFKTLCTIVSMIFNGRIWTYSLPKTWVDIMFVVRLKQLKSNLILQSAELYKNEEIEYQLADKQECFV